MTAQISDCPGRHPITLGVLYRALWACYSMPSRRGINGRGHSLRSLSRDRDERPTRSRFRSRSLSRSFSSATARSRSRSSSRLSPSEPESHDRIAGHHRALSSAGVGGGGEGSRIRGRFRVL